MDDLPEFILDGTNLTGGNDGTTPAITSEAFIAASKNPFYEPVPFDASYISADAPSL